MKKFFLLAILAVPMLFTACNKDKTAQVKDTAKMPKANAAQKTGEATKQAGAIAYLEIDSLATQYQFCIDQQKVLEQKHSALQQKLNTEGNAIEKAMGNYQKKVQNGQIKDEATAKSEQASIQRQQSTFQQHQTQYENEFAKATTDYQKELRKRLNDYLAVYNKDGRFALILTNSEQMMNVLYADPALDITKEVIDGLNAEYKK